MDKSAVVRGLRRSLGINALVSGFGVLFGVAAVAAGIPGWIAVLMSIVVLSGAAQFSAVALVAAAAGPGSLLVAAAGLGLRHLPMAAALSRVLEPTSVRKRLALSYVLTDETFGLTLAAAEAGEPRPGDFMLGANAGLLAGWVAGTAVGAAFGAVVDPDALGLGFLLPLLFLGLAGDHLHDRRGLLVAAGSAGAALVAVKLVPGPWRITAAAFTAAAVAACFPSSPHGEAS